MTVHRRSLFSVAGPIRVWAVLVCGWAAAAASEVRVWEGDWPPAPKPVRATVDLGVYIFPGWYRDTGRGDYPYRTHDEDSEWRLVAAKPQPRPLLGFYDDSLPEVNDWHILWALEHGISWFAFDWYWNGGEHRLLRTLEQGFLRARHAPLMRFCIHWCNHGLDWQTRQWHPSMGLADAGVAEGYLEARVTGGDPAFACPVRIPAAEAYSHVAIRMRLDGGDRGQFFWSAPGQRESEDSSIAFETFPDGQFHEYLLDLRAVPAWRGAINRLRLDPNSGCPGTRVAIDSIRLLTQAGTLDGALRWDFDAATGFAGLNRAGLDFSPRALLDMTAYMADRYFTLPNYLMVEGRPMVMVWDPRALIEANGGPEGFRRVLDDMNKLLRARGLQDLFLVSMHTGPTPAAAGFSAVTGYGYYGVDPDSAFEWRRGYSVPYEDVVTHYNTVWRSLSAKLALPYITPIGSNWDDRPRAGDRALVMTGKTPALFERLCRDSRDYIRPPLNMAVIEAWNEWGEGSFIEPDREWGFAFLDAVRRTFTDAPESHVDFVPDAAAIARYQVLKPEEIAAAERTAGLPYPDPPRLPKVARWSVDEPLPAGGVQAGWEFEGADHGWLAHQMTDPELRDGVLTAVASGDDPQLLVPEVGVAIADLAVVAFRMRTEQGVAAGELFWTTEAEPELSADKSARFVVRDDGDWHVYQLSRAVEGKWQGRLKRLRLDVGRKGDRVEVDWLRIMGKTP